MKISVIIPAYNAAKTIERCVLSVQKQSGAEIETVIVNDGSSDNIEHVLEPYRDVVKLISIENGGVANARNVGLKNASGDFVMFLDADDELGDGCIQCVAEKQAQTKADIIRFGYVLVYSDGRRQKPLHYFDKEELIEKKDFKTKIYPLYINGIMLNSICMTLFKRELAEGLEFKTGMATAEDAVFSIGLYTNAEKVLILPEEYYIYNQSNESLTGSGLSVLTKYKCNMILSGEIIKHLPEWKMNTLMWRVRAFARPIVLTFDKLRRTQLNSGG